MVAALALALPAAATATESVVPPENSAATQYTEVIPTAGGNKQAGGGKQGNRSPQQVLGSKTAHKLESHGKQGREVAEVVAETAPETSATATAPAQPEPPSQSAGGGGQSQRGGGSSARIHAPEQQSRGATSELPDGSSGLGEVVAAATGNSSSGQLGILLLLAIAAAVVWALAYLIRQRKRPPSRA